VYPPLFLVEVEIFKAEIEYCDFKAGEVLQPRPGVTIRTAPLDHPDGATGYRIEYAGRSVASITDTESRYDHHIRNITSLARHADLMIFDCTYTEKKFCRAPVGGIPLGNRAFVLPILLAQDCFAYSTTIQTATI